MAGCVWESQRNTTNTEECFKERKTGCLRSESALIAVANTSKTMLNSSGESGHPCLVPDFKGNAFNFSPLKIMFAVGLSYIAFIMLRYVPSIPAFWRVFIINGC